jgi:hypothetical protein
VDREAFVRRMPALFAGGILVLIVWVVFVGYWRTDESVPVDIVQVERLAGCLQLYAERNSGRWPKSIEELRETLPEDLRDCTPSSFHYFPSGITVPAKLIQNRLDHGSPTVQILAVRKRAIPVAGERRIYGVVVLSAWPAVCVCETFWPESAYPEVVRELETAAGAPANPVDHATRP